MVSPTNLQDQPEPVFVDGSGRRRRVLATAGAGVGATLVVALGVVVAGFFGASPTHLPGLPGGDRHTGPATGGNGKAGLEGRSSDATSRDAPRPTASATATPVPVAVTTGRPTASSTPSSHRHEPTQTPSRPGKPR